MGEKMKNLSQSVVSIVLLVSCFVIILYNVNLGKQNNQIRDDLKISDISWNKNEGIAEWKMTINNNSDNIAYKDIVIKIEYIEFSSKTRSISFLQHDLLKPGESVEIEFTDDISKYKNIAGGRVFIHSAIEVKNVQN